MTKTYELPNGKMIKADVDEKYHTATVSVYALDGLVEAVNQTGNWIPVSERLPEESTAVLIWCPERKNIYCAYLEEKQWWIFGAYFQKVPLDVTAWMPLLEPYETQESEE